MSTTWNRCEHVRGYASSDLHAPLPRLLLKHYTSVSDSSLFLIEVHHHCTHLHHLY